MQYEEEFGEAAAVKEIGHHQRVGGFEDVQRPQADPLHAAAPVVEGGHDVGGK